jgi:nitrate/nitrite transporter NarK
VLNLSALEAALILNLNSALGMMLGLFNGALLKVFGFRKIAVLGGIFFSGGIMGTAFAESFKHFLITYSIITCKSCLLMSVIETINLLHL